MDATNYVAVKPDRPIYGEFYRHLIECGYHFFTDGAANVMLFTEDEVDFALTCLADRGIGYELL